MKWSRTRIISLIAVGTIVVLAGIGCGGDSGGDVEISASSDCCTALPKSVKGSLVATLLTDTQADKEYQLGFLIPNLPDPVWKNMLDNMRLWAASHGNVDIVYEDAGGFANVDKQVSQLEDMVQRGVDGILIAPVSPEALEPGVTKAVEQGIPVMTFITTAGGPVTTRLSNDNYGMGRQYCELMISQDVGQGAVFLPGPPNVQSLTDRYNGFKACVQSAAGKLTVLDATFGPADRSSGLTQMEDYLQAYGDEITVASSTLTTVVNGMADAIVRADKKKDIYVVGSGADPTTIKKLEAGEIDVTVDENTIVMAAGAVAAMVAKLNGDEVPKRIDVPFGVVKAADAATYNWGWSGAGSIATSN